MAAADRLAVVTGAGRGFGRAVAEALTDQGRRVVACVRTRPATGKAGLQVVVQDVRDPVGTELLAAIGDRPVDALINNAGVGAKATPPAGVDPRQILDALDVNMAGTLRLTQALLPALTAAPDPVIVNVSSRLGSLTAQAEGEFATRRTSYAYRISKAAQNMLTITLAQESAGRVHCWAVHPGSLTTAMGATDATTPAGEAALRLVDLLNSPDPASPRFVSLDGPDLRW
ncbi:SDR family NAD(P)-dependent oxidoreductase [Paractinoplanes ferrugineus]|uniref:Short-chain dehydrogenase n=1 Tax=Paractinoplanes ferrugineus TaxID=113564 RepID=A0A919J8H1_9ACTN|nr:SDR family NAD(P)-dependent oxidoreductase [Actinoplanes ferrugineus]GIE15710.1 short-chain dehydrogenase [Actinoplanes ferrugineus]